MNLSQTGELQNLIASAKEHHVEFIYAISPGLDVTFSNPKEVATLKRKIDQVQLYTTSHQEYKMLIIELYTRSQQEEQILLLLSYIWKMSSGYSCR